MTAVILLTLSVILLSPCGNIFSGEISIASSPPAGVSMAPAAVSTAPAAVSMAPAAVSTAPAAVSTAPAAVSTAPAAGGSEADIEGGLREARSRLRKARSALKRAEAAGDPGPIERAREEYTAAQSLLESRRSGLRSALRDGAVSREYAELKRLVREDLNAVRRARYALEKSRRRSDAKGMGAAEDLLKKVKKRLKERRMRMRSLLRGGS